MLLLLFLKEFGILNGGRREQEECLFLTLENKVILHDFFFHFFFFLFFWVDIKIAVMVMPDRGVETRSTQIKYGGTRFFCVKDVVFVDYVVGQNFLTYFAKSLEYMGSNSIFYVNQCKLSK